MKLGKFLCCMFVLYRFCFLILTAHTAQKAYKMHMDNQPVKTFGLTRRTTQCAWSRFVQNKRVVFHSENERSHWIKTQTLTLTLKLTICKQTNNSILLKVPVFRRAKLYWNRIELLSTLVLKFIELHNQLVILYEPRERLFEISSFAVILVSFRSKYAFVVDFVEIYFLLLHNFSTTLGSKYRKLISVYDFGLLSKYLVIRQFSHTAYYSYT